MNSSDDHVKDHDLSVTHSVYSHFSHLEMQRLPLSTHAFLASTQCTKVFGSSRGDVHAKLQVDRAKMVPRRENSGKLLLKYYRHFDAANRAPIDSNIKKYDWITAHNAVLMQQFCFAPKVRCH
jgi:hypothetical protein